MDKLVIGLVTGYIIFMSILGLLLMGIDKRRAIKRAWRISEKTLLMTAFLGGGIGSCLGMYVFRHKNRHLTFMILLPLAAVMDLAIILKLYKLL